LKNYKNLLANPSRKSRPWAVWIWNLGINKDEMELQLNSLISKGFGGVAIRVGRDMDPPFMSEEFFELFGRALQIAQEKEIGIRFLEDFSLPHAMVLQNLTRHSKSYRAQRLVLVHSEVVPSGSAFERTIEDPDSTIIIAAKMKKDKIDAEQTKVLPLSSKKELSWKSSGGDWKILILKKEFTPAPVCGGFFPNVFNSKAISAYISNILEVLKSKFIKYIPGTFEGIVAEMPSILPGENSIPWDDDLVVRYRSKYKKELSALLPTLFCDVEPKYARNRSHVYMFLLQSMYEIFALALDEWCRKNRLSPWLLCPERSIMNQPNTLKDFFTIPEGKFSALGIQNIEGIDDNFAILKAMSDMNCNEFRRETIAVIGRNKVNHGSSLQSLKSEIDRQVFLGASAILLDGLFFNLDHHNTLKSPYNTFWYSREWEHMEGIVSYAGRMKELASELQPARDIAMLMPTVSMLADYLPGNDEAIRAGIENIRKVVDDLRRQNLDYDIISEEFLLSSCSIRTTGEFGTADRVRKGNYRALIIPYCRLISKNLFVFLEKLGSKNSAIIFIDQPPQGCLDEGISAAFTARVEKLMKAKSGAVHALPAASLPGILEKFVSPVAAIVQGKKCPDVSITRISDAQESLYLIQNASLSQEYIPSVELPAGKYFYFVDCKNGNMQEIAEVDTKEGKSTFPISLSPRQSCCVLASPAKIAGPTPSHKEKQHPLNILSAVKKNYRLVLRNQWKFTAESLNVLPLASWNTRIGLSRELGGYSHYYETYFEVKEVPGTCLMALGNPLNVGGSAGDTLEVSINGNKLERLRETAAPLSAPAPEGALPLPDLKMLAQATPFLRRLALWNIRPALAKGYNRISLRTSGICNDPPVVLYPPLVIGDFSVEKGQKGWIVSNVSPLAGCDSWTEYGFPYLSGIGVYHQIFEVPGEYKHLILKFSQLSGSAEVTVNGNKLALLHCPPFEVDITAACTLKRNELSIKVVNTLDNVVRMNRRSSGLTGEVYVDVF
jgi:hypothetical protein